MGSGKTTIGKKLSKNLNLKFLDTDKIIEKKNSMSINQIFNIKGEKYFRNEENKIFKELDNHKKTIISTGGGFVSSQNMLNLINKNNFTIYLKYELDSLYNRLLNDKKNRPLIKKLTKIELKKHIEKLLSSREKIYSKCKVVIECKNLNNNEILRQINSTIFIRKINPNILL